MDTSHVKTVWLVLLCLTSVTDCGVWMDGSSVSSSESSSAEESLARSFRPAEEWRSAGVGGRLSQCTEYDASYDKMND